jgi:hypothetical protein
MEIQEALRIGYRRELFPNVVINSIPVPVFGEGSVPENQIEPYIIITAYTGNQIRTDKCKPFEVTQLVDIVTASNKPMGFGQANLIADQVENIINPDNRIDIDITDLGYRIGDTYSIESNPLANKTETRYIYRILKRYRHLISKT